jgi:hypothetical protein
MRSLLFSLLVLAASAVAQPPNWRFLGAEVGRPGAVVKNAPFSAVVTTETTMTLQDSNHIRQTSTLHLYRDSEGRTRREQSLNNSGDTVVFINDPVAGANYALNPASKTANRSVAGNGPPPGARGGRMRGGPPRESGGGAQPNVKTESLGSKSIEGVMAEGTRTTMTIPTGQIGNEQPMQTVVETWYSAELQTVILSRRSDPRSGETVTRYTNISRAEPSHTLFEVPADYKTADSQASRGPRSGAK